MPSPAEAAGPPLHVESPAPAQDTGSIASAPAAVVPGSDEADRQAIVLTLSAYATALEQRDIDRVKLVWPGLGSAVERNLREGFAFARSLRVVLQPTQIRLVGDTAIATCARHDEVITRDGQRVQNDTRATLTLRREGERWLIESIK